MLNSSVLDVGLGLILIYLILGLICTSVHEWIAQRLKMRATTLKDGIRVMLSGPPDGTSQFRPEDINPMKLLFRLAASGDKLAAALGLDPAAAPDPRSLSRAEATAVAQALAAKLNSVLSDADLWQKIDLSRASSAVLAVVRKASAGPKLQRANYDLLKAAYPDEIAGLAQSFYSHALIKSLAKPGSHPSYVPAHTFSAVLIDILKSPSANGGEAESSSPLDSIRSSISALPDSDVKRSLSALVESAGNQVTAFETSLESWFNDAMDRVSGWYKNKAQIVTAVVAAGVTIFANADTVQIARKLYLNPAVRAKLSQDAAAASRQQGTAGPTQQSVLTPQEKADLGEVTGWSAEFETFHRMQAESEGLPQDKIAEAKTDDSFPGFNLTRDQPRFWSWVWAIVPGHLLGWFLTAAAASLGAPFWFDTLNKFMNIRSTGTAPNEKGQNLSKA
jgi:hypothetical protein